MFRQEHLLALPEITINLFRHATFNRERVKKWLWGPILDTGPADINSGLPAM